MTGFGKKKNDGGVEEQIGGGGCSSSKAPSVDIGKIVEGVFFCEDCSIVLGTQTTSLSPSGLCPYCGEDVIIFDPFKAYEQMVAKIKIQC